MEWTREIGGDGGGRAYEAVKYVLPSPLAAYITRHCHPYNRGRTPDVVMAFISVHSNRQSFDAISITRR